MSLVSRKRVPDLLTFSRGAIALAILGLVPVGPRALRSVLLLLLLGWTTDMLDGRIARRVAKGPSWIGEHDFHFDMAMVLASAIYLVWWGLVPRGLGIWYLAVGVPLSLFTALWGGEFLKFKSFTMLIAFPWVFAPFIVAYFHDPLMAYVGLLWMVGALIVDWRRFLGVVGDFLSGAKAFLHR
jgi:phosphatidylglycerophosphate synthase